MIALKSLCVEQSLLFVFLLEGERERVDAVTFPRRSWTVIENVTKVTSAAFADYFDPFRTQCVIGSFFYSVAC